MLNPVIFRKKIKHMKLEPDLDCFASGLNTHLPTYISCKPDPYVSLNVVFSVHQGFCNRYLFLPFQINWPYPSKDSHRSNRGCSRSSKVANSTFVQPFLGMFSQKPYVLTPHKENLLLPQKSEELHPLWPKPTLLIEKVSGKYSQVQTLIMILLTF